jgi:hypothetical protein
VLHVPYLMPRFLLTFKTPANVRRPAPSNGQAIGSNGEPQA